MIEAEERRGVQEESLFVRVHVRAFVRAKYSGLDVKSYPSPAPSPSLLTIDSGSQVEAGLAAGGF